MLAGLKVNARSTILNFTADGTHICYMYVHMYATCMLRTHICYMYAMYAYMFHVCMYAMYACMLHECMYATYACMLHVCYLHMYATYTYMLHVCMYATYACMLHVCYIRMYATYTYACMHVHATCMLRTHLEFFLSFFN